MDDTPTTLFPAVPEPPPVFVDPSGQRRRRLRWIAYGLGLAGLAYTAMVGVSFAGTPVNPETVLPYVEPTQQPWQPPPPAANTAAPTPTPTVRVNPNGPGPARPASARPNSSTAATSGGTTVPNTPTPSGDASPDPVVPSSPAAGAAELPAVVNSTPDAGGSGPAT